jgi:NADPH:quinone reductase-like Zn-dependent oxidoreductase
MIGADQVIATDDDNVFSNLPPLDAVADTVNGSTAEKLIAKIKQGGVFASPPRNAEKYPTVKVVPVFATLNVNVLQFMPDAIRNGKLVIPIRRKLPLSKAGTMGANPMNPIGCGTSS